MKKPQISLLIVLTCIFAAFILGFFTGRNLNRAPVLVQTLNASSAELSSETLPAQTGQTDNTDAAEATESTETSAPDFSDTSIAAETVIAETAASGLININTATAQQLQSLPGIGEVLSQRIIEYRDAHGAFQSVGELLNVSGIGEKKLEAIWDLVTIGG